MAGAGAFGNGEVAAVLGEVGAGFGFGGLVGMVGEVVFDGDGEAGFVKELLAKQDFIEILGGGAGLPGVGAFELFGELLEALVGFGLGAGFFSGGKLGEEV